jgi:penicillin-binding protein 1C
MKGRAPIWIARAALSLVAALGALAVCTLAAMRPLPASLGPDPAAVNQPQFLDHSGRPLSVTYQNQWNVYDCVPLHAIPPLVQQAFIFSEDKRFFDHGGADWLARFQAVVQNLRARRVVRGASTISEQVVRMLHPRPRTLWARWVEGIEASLLERRFPKATILEFYLNQVPYARQRRGVVQAARAYFDRELSTLSVKEMLALAVLVRAPGRLDLARDPARIEQPLMHLAERMYREGALSHAEFQGLQASTFTLLESYLDCDAAHFIGHIRSSGLVAPGHQGRVRTTLDGGLQRQVQELLDGRLANLRTRGVTDGAVLVVDHETNQVLVWVNGGGFSLDQPGGSIDAVTIPRQPGSTLKPFLYALAIEKGWNAATLIDDTPLAEPVGFGLHTFHNYSRHYYGTLRLREALGNSLNIPAVRTVDFVGRKSFLERLHGLGFASLGQQADYYGDGLALGNGEVTLLELVRAYATLARGGVWAPLAMVFGDLAPVQQPRRLFSEEASTLIGNILSDPEARRLEFGEGHLLRFPVQTAIKTGTSSQHRDAWAVGFSHRYTAGVWMGNLDRRPMQEVTGSIGPALVLRAVFAELNRRCESKPLRLSPKLQAVAICRITGKKAAPECPSLVEWFEGHSAPTDTCLLHGAGARGRGTTPGSPGHLAGTLRLSQPTAGLQLAMDPRIPDDLEAFSFLLPDTIYPVKTEWLVDGRVVGRTGRGEHRFLWPLCRGEHTAFARVWRRGRSESVKTEAVLFVVK